jgi:hypothetical protein
VPRQEHDALDVGLPALGVGHEDVPGQRSRPKKSLKTLGEGERVKSEGDTCLPKAVCMLDIDVTLCRDPVDQRAQVVLPYIDG